MKEIHTFVQEMRAVERQITSSVGRVRAVLHNLHQGVEADVLPREKVLAMLEEIEGFLEQISD